ARLSVRARMAPPQSWPRAWQAPMMPATFRTFSAQAMAKPEVKVFYENDTHTVCAVVRDPNSQKAAIIDSVLGFNYYSGSTDSTHADVVADYVKSNKLE
ncbi:blh, partial [Symbiodinium sp. KB8]